MFLSNYKTPSNEERLEYLDNPRKKSKYMKRKEVVDTTRSEKLKLINDRYEEIFKQREKQK